MGKTNVVDMHISFLRSKIDIKLKTSYQDSGWRGLYHQSGLGG